MKAREKKLLFGFAGITALVLLLKVGPGLLSVVDLSEKVKAARVEYEEFAEVATQFSEDQKLYQSYVERTGDIEPAEVEQDLDGRLNKLLTEKSLRRA